MIDSLLSQGENVFAISSKDELGEPSTFKGERFNIIKNCQLISLPLSKDHKGYILKYLKIYFSDLIRFHRELRKVVTINKIDIIIFYNPNVLPLVLSPFMPKRVTKVYYAAELLNPRSQPQYYCIERLLCRKMNMIICCEENRAKIMQKRYHLKTTPTVMINAVPPEYVSLKKNFLRDKLQIKKTDIVVIYQGEIHSIRCCYELAAATSQLPEHIKLVLIGKCHDQAYMKKIMDHATVTNSQNRIFHIDKVPYNELFDYTVGADIGAVFYKNIDENHYYCAPNKLSEYTLCGLAVVGSNFPGLAEQIEGNQIGKVANPNSIKEIYSALNSITESDKTLQMFKKNSGKVYNRNFNFNTLSSHLIEKISSYASKKI